MKDKQIIKQLAERYKEICRSPFSDGYTFTAFDGECAKKGFTSDDIKNYIEKEKQERKAKRTESIKSLKEQLKRKEQECEELKERLNCNCFDSKNNNNRCISYNRMAEDYERDLKQLDQLKRQHEADKGLITSTGKMNYQLMQKYDKMKNCITQIKEIAKKSMREGKMLSGGWLYQFIEQKISEAENE